MNNDTVTELLVNVKDRLSKEIVNNLYFLFFSIVFTEV